MAKQQAIKVKRTINLAFKENPINPAMLAAGLVGIAVISVSVAKFAVIDRFDRLSEREAEVSAIRTRLETMQNEYADYRDVESLYNQYTYRGYDRTLYDRVEILELLERRVTSMCTLTQFTVSGRDLSLTVGGLTLEGTSSLLDSLESDDMVESAVVPVFNADDNNSGVSSSIQVNIVLTDALETAAARKAAEAEGKETENPEVEQPQEEAEQPEAEQSQEEGETP